MGINLSKRATNDPMTRCFSDLPESIIAEIISTLPVQSIIQCRRVCKTWLHLVSSKYFNNFVLKNNMTSLTFILKGRGGTRYCLFEFQNRTSLTKTRRYPIKLIKLDFKFRNPFSGLASVIDNCNGLFCLYVTTINDSLFIRIWNPVLGQYITFPIGNYNSAIKGYGFGHCHFTNHYKVIRVVKNEIAFSVEIITLGTDSTWRRVGNTYKRPVGRFNFRYLNGNIHWICEDDDDDSSRAGLGICSFNCCTEQLGFIFPPPFDCSTRYDRHKRTTIYKHSVDYKLLHVIRDCLCVVVGNHRNLVLWSMKDYGVAESWSKHVYVEFPHSFRSKITNFVSTLWDDDKEFCFIQTLGDMGYFDSTKMQYVKLKTTIDDDEHYSKSDAYPYFPSFIPLFEVFKEEPSKLLTADKGCFRQLLSILKKCFYR